MKTLTKDDFRIVKKFYINDFVYFIEQKYRRWLTKTIKWRRLGCGGWSDYYTFTYKKAKKAVKKLIEDSEKQKVGAVILPA